MIIFMRDTYKIIDEQYPYFITSTIVDWINIFTSEEYFEILMDNFRFYQRKFEMEIIAYVIMPNHFHMISSCKKLKLAVQSIKSFTAKEILKQLYLENNIAVMKNLSERKANYKIESNFQVWQEGYHPKQINDYEMLKQKIEYIHNNPVKKKLVLNPEDWKYSSAAYYLNETDCGLNISKYH